MSSPLDTALDLVRRHNFHVFPITAGATAPPLVSDWPNAATSDEDTIMAWAEMFPGCNWGCHPERSGHVVFDLDRKHGKDGVAALAELQKQHGKLPPTLRFGTPSKGYHLVFRGSAPTSSDDRIASGVDVRGRGGYIVLPGGVRGDGCYSIKSDVPIANAPQWLLTLAQPKPTPKLAAADDVALDTPGMIRRAREHIDRDLRQWGVVEIGNYSDDRAYDLACWMRSDGLSDETILELLSEHWAPDDFDEDWLAAKIISAERSAQNERGATAVAPNFPADAVAMLVEKTGAPASVVTVLDPWARPYTHDDLERVRESDPPPTFLIPHYVLRGFNNMLTGPGGSFKSTIALDHAVCASVGAKLYGAEIEQMPAIILSYEDPRRMVLDRADAIVAHIERGNGGKTVKPDYRLFDFQPAKHEHRLLVVTPDGEVLEQEGWKRLCDMLAGMPGPKFAMVDSFYNAFDFRGPSKVNESAIMAVLGRLDSLAVATTTTFETICHPSRAAMAAGEFSMGFGAAFDNGPRLRTYAKAVPNVHAVDLKVVKYQYGAPGHQDRFYHQNGVARPTVATVYVPFAAAILKVATDYAEHGEPIRRDRSSKTPGVDVVGVVIDQIEALCGRRPTKIDIRGVLDAEVSQGRWWYQAGRSHGVAGYHPAPRAANVDASEPDLDDFGEAAE
jgi:hypothetical protein